jgi:hypothetical protein
VRRERERGEVLSARYLELLDFGDDGVDERALGEVDQLVDVVRVAVLDEREVGEIHAPTTPTSC